MCLNTKKNQTGEICFQISIKAKGSSLTGSFEKLRRDKDNALLHESKVVISFFEEKERDILEWSSNSPDLNPRETF